VLSSELSYYLLRRPEIQPPTSIRDAIKTNKCLVALGSKHVTIQNIHNSIKKADMANSIRNILKNFNIEANINATLERLRQTRYQCEQVHTGTFLVFANDDQLDALGTYGHFVSIINATHNTNKYAWKLTTLFVPFKNCILCNVIFIEWSSCCHWISFDPK
jgi:hypothetical protein